MINTPSESEPEQIAPGQSQSFRSKVAKHFPRGQVIPYLVVGGFNTVFGYTTFAILNYFFRKWGVPVSYIFAFAASNMINITVAWANYKLFVFKTRGNYLREWLKAMAVYWSQFLPGVILIPIAVRLLNWLLPKQLHGFHRSVSTVEAAPYIASAILTVFGVVSSFLLHKNVTFRQSPTAVPSESV